MLLWNSIEGPAEKFWDLQGGGFIHIWACLYARLRMRPRVGVFVGVVTTTCIAENDSQLENGSHSQLGNGSHS